MWKAQTCNKDNPPSHRPAAVCQGSSLGSKAGHLPIAKSQILSTATSPDVSKNLSNWDPADMTPKSFVWPIWEQIFIGVSSTVMCATGQHGTPSFCFTFLRGSQFAVRLKSKRVQAAFLRIKDFAKNCEAILHQTCQSQHVNDIEWPHHKAGGIRTNVHTRHGLHHEMLRVGGVRFEVQVMLQPPTLPHFSSLRVSFWLCSIPAPPRLHYSSFPAPFEFLPYYFPVPFWLRSNFISTQVLLAELSKGKWLFFSGSAMRHPAVRALHKGLQFQPWACNKLIVLCYVWDQCVHAHQSDFHSCWSQIYGSHEWSAPLVLAWCASIWSDSATKWEFCSCSDVWGQARASTRLTPKRSGQFLMSKFSSLSSSNRNMTPHQAAQSARHAMALRLRGKVWVAAS